MRIQIPILIGLTCLVWAPLSAETYIYRMTSDGQTTDLRVTITDTPTTSGLIRRFQRPDQVEMRTLAADGTTLKSELNGPTGNIVRTKVGERITVLGTWQGTERRLSVDLQGLPWFAGFDDALSAMMASSRRELHFLNLSPGGDAVETVLTLVGPEAVGGRPGFKVKASLGGMLALFWSAEFWCDDQGLILKFHGTMGPGTPLVTQVLDRVEP